MKEKAPKLQHFRTMDVSWAKFFRMFPTKPLELTHPDKEIKRTTQFIAFCWAQYRFGDSEILDNLWKRINSMIETLDVYKDIVNKGRSEGIAYGKAEDLVRIIQKVFKMIIPNDIKDKIYAQNDINVLNEWLELTLEVPDFDTFRKKTGL